jgi:hypothetical protein
MIRDILQTFRPLGTQNTVNKSTDCPTVFYHATRRKFLFLGRDYWVRLFPTRRRPPSSRPSSGIVPAAVRRRTLPPSIPLKSDAFVISTFPSLQNIHFYEVQHPKRVSFRVQNPFWPIAILFPRKNSSLLSN